MHAREGEQHNFARRSSTRSSQPLRIGLDSWICSRSSASSIPYRLNPATASTRLVPEPQLHPPVLSHFPRTLLHLPSVRLNGVVIVVGTRGKATLPVRPKASVRTVSTAPLSTSQFSHVMIAEEALGFRTTSGLNRGAHAALYAGIDAVRRNSPRVVSRSSKFSTWVGFTLTCIRASIPRRNSGTSSASTRERSRRY